MPYAVRWNAGGPAISVEPNETVLAAATRNGLALPYSCRTGTCGACKAKLVSGEIDYATTDLSGLTASEQAAGFILLCQAQPRSDLTLDQCVNAAANPIKTLPCKVARMERLCHDVMGLWLQLPRTESFSYEAGQYIDVLLKSGKHRSFSLAGAPDSSGLLELHIRHYPHGAFSDQVFSGLQVQSLLRIRGPLGNFKLNTDSERPMIFVAGGTGFAPVKAIIETSLARAMRRPIFLYRGVRTASDLYLHALATQWEKEYPHIRYIPVLSEPSSEDAWTGRTGLVHLAALDDFQDVSQYEVYTCGPPPMVYATRDGFLAKGLSADRIFSDAFEFAAT